jgi:hypothetical protein
MRKIATSMIGVTALCLASLAFADGNGNGNGNGHGNGHGGGNGNGGGNEQVQSDPTVQVTMLINTAVVNSAMGPNGLAQQNLASNVGSFSSNATMMQMAAVRDSVLMNWGWGGQANQNIASNVGEDGLRTSTYQVAYIKSSAVINRASWGAKALQNLSSNSNCLTCQ